MRPRVQSTHKESIKPLDSLQGIELVTGNCWPKEAPMSYYTHRTVFESELLSP